MQHHFIRTQAVNLKFGGWANNSEKLFFLITNIMKIRHKDCPPKDRYET